jgi:hypothetical protein
MITRFFKKKPKPTKAAPSKKEIKKTPKSAEKQEQPSLARTKPSPNKKLLTAEGWKRMMMSSTHRKK